MNLLQFEGYLVFMGQRFPVQFQIDIGQPAEPTGSTLEVDDFYEFDRSEIDSGLPVEVRPHPGRRISRAMLDQAGSDEDKESLLAARFPWLADCWTAEPASVSGAAVSTDPLAADLDRLAEIAGAEPERLLKSDGSVNKSAVARELGLPAGGSAWRRVTRLAERLRDMVA